jgi:sulfofructose kinase
MRTGFRSGFVWKGESRKMMGTEAVEPVLMIGLSTYDITVPMDGPIVENQKYRLKVELAGGGGPAFNAACLCATWGLHTYLRSRIGTDEHGRAMRALMEEAGVDLSEVLMRKEFHTPYSYIFTNRRNGNRTVMNFRDEMETRPFPFSLEKASIILTDGHEKQMSFDAFERFPDAIRVLDAGNFKDYTLEVARKVDYIVSSQVFAEAYAGKKVNPDDPDNCREIFEAMEEINHGRVVITLGEQGLLYRAEAAEEETHQKGEVRRMDAFPAQAIDTTGAGDIFHGAFVYGLAKGMDFEAILRLASMTAAISVERQGSRDSIPTPEEVRRRLDGVISSICTKNE